MVCFITATQEFVEMALDTLSDYPLDEDSSILISSGNAILNDWDETSARDWFEGFRGFIAEKVRQANGS